MQWVWRSQCSIYGHRFGVMASRHLLLACMSMHLAWSWSCCATPFWRCALALQKDIAWPFCATAWQNRLSAKQSNHCRHESGVCRLHAWVAAWHSKASSTPKFLPMAVKGGLLELNLSQPTIMINKYCCDLVSLYSRGMPHSWPISPGSEDSSWSTETQSPGIIIVWDGWSLFSCAFLLQGFFVALPNMRK